MEAVRVYQVNQTDLTEIVSRLDTLIQLLDPAKSKVTFPPETKIKAQGLLVFRESYYTTFDMEFDIQDVGTDVWNIKLTFYSGSNTIGSYTISLYGSSGDVGEFILQPYSGGLVYYRSRNDSTFYLSAYLSQLY